MAAEIIDHATLSRLVEAGAVRGAHVDGQDGWMGGYDQVLLISLNRDSFYTMALRPLVDVSCD